MPSPPQNRKTPTPISDTAWRTIGFEESCLQLLVVTSQFPHSMPLADLDKTQTTVTEAEAEAAASAQTKSKSQRRRRSKREPVREKTTATQREDVFVHIDMPPPAPRKSGSDTGLHRAKIVAMPIASDVSDVSCLLEII
ncbi:hypothetical protein TELCIR_07677 [Teladorsagia circumcincta]|uniref:Uncharacterized protein n=1 Tax=Teladorsagia circumcincta TaxID=45464 RepID=A0A2G9UJR6_TELCI|nr:hypothetical protein TELCIR_07677 [Teladorsagia circumcincta]